jgi:hypothetical protein
MPQTKFTNADLKKKPQQLQLDLTPVDDNQLDLTPVYDTVDLRNHQIPYKGDQFREPVQGPQDRSLGEDIWTELNRPHFNGFSEGAKALGDMIPGANTTNPHLGYARGAVQGMLEGAGNLLSGFTSDLGLGSLAGGLGEYAGLAKVAPEVLQGLHTASKVAGMPFAISGAHKVLDSKLPWSERLQGIPEMAGGIAPLLHLPESSTGQHSDLNQAKLRTSVFKSRMPLEGEHFERPGPYDGQGGLPFNENDTLPVGPEAPAPVHQQPGLDFGPHPIDNTQIPLDFSEGVRGEPTQQGLDLVGVPVNMPHEFSPDMTFMEKPKTSRLSAFDRPADNTAGLGNNLSAFQKALGDSSTGRPRPVVDEPDIFPKEMRAINNPENVALGGASERGLDILGTTLYSENRPTIAAKELLQNSVDEHRIAGVKAPIRFLFNHGDKLPDTGADGRSLTIADKGRGISKEGIYTVLTNMFESGKANEEGASGGFGIAKAAPMMGGKYARFESVVVENGKKIRYTFEGTPKQLKNQKEGVPIKTEVVSSDTPTGFKAKVYYDKDTSISRAKDKINSMAQHSMNNDSPIEIAESYGGATDQDIENFFNDKPAPKYGYFADGNNIRKLKSSPVPQLQDTIKLPGADIDIHYETPNQNSLAQQADIRVANNGLHQFDFNKLYSQRGALKNVPSEIKFNVRPNVAEGQEGYPFTANREQLQAETGKAINDWIDKNIVSGALEKQRNSLRDIYANMRPLNTQGSNTAHRPQVLFDPNNILSPEQHQALSTNAFINDFADAIDNIIHNALEATNSEWGTKIEKTGITLDPNVHGIWIPNPDQRDSATILINPFINIGKHDPLNSARENVATAWHEVAHTGGYGDSNHPINWTNVDPKDPEVAVFFQKYMNEVSHASLVGDSGHGLDWLRHTAEVYSKAGTNSWKEAVGALHDIFTNGTDKYTPEVQDALQIYTDRTRAGGTEKDILSGTGINSEVRPGEKNSVFSNAGPNAKRPVRPVQLGKQLTSEFNKPIKATPEVVNKIQQEIPQAEIPRRVANISEHLKQVETNPEISKDEKENLLEKALNFQRTLLTSYDVSAPGRQGLPLIGRKEWWTAWKPMLESYGSQKAYENVMQSIREDPSGLFNGDKSFANEAGLELTDTLSHREELFRSKWAEDHVPGVKASVRAYTAYLNKLRADTFKSMVKEAGAETNMVDAKKIADFINVATGRGSLGAFESAAKPLAQIFFSPRLTASRLQMYTRTFNPYFYADVPPVVRKNQLRSALSLAGTGILIGQLSKMAGATVNSEPTNSDFGKIRFGNTRIDPFAGHQQFLVAAARLITGKTTSSTSDKTTSLTTGKFGMPSRASVAGNFMKNKLAPIPSFVWSWMEGKDFDGTPFNAKNEMASRTIPIVMQDLHDIWKENPALVPGLASSFSSAIGGGVQTYGR